MVQASTPIRTPPMLFAEKSRSIFWVAECPAAGYLPTRKTDDETAGGTPLSFLEIDSPGGFED
jgi:hypothetical protein